MQNHIEIEYCGGWGFESSAVKLRKVLKKVFPIIPIDCFSADTITSVIEVSLITNQQKIVVWSDARVATNFGHE